MSSIKELLSSTPVSAIPLPKGKVITISGKEKLYDAFKTLIQHNILSAPVLDPATNKYTGFLDMRDLVSFVVFVDDDQKSDVPNNLQDILDHGTKMLKVPLEGATTTYLSRRNPLHSVPSTGNLYDVSQILSKAGVHRVPVVNEQGEIINIISQTSLITFLNKHSSHFADFTKTLAQTGVGSKPVLSVHKDVPAIEAFRIMDNKKISGLAVVDSDGKLVGNTSASDLKLFLKDPSIGLINMPIMQFLNAIRRESIDIMAPTITCKSTDSLALAIGKLSSTKVHRLFIADDETGYKPIACLSITDVLKFVVHL